MEGQLLASSIQMGVATGATLGQLERRVHVPVGAHQPQMGSEVTHSEQEVRVSHMSTW